jgi:hypothetical protein
VPLTANQYATDWSQYSTSQVPQDWYRHRTLSMNGWWNLKVETDASSPTGRALVLTGAGGASRLFAWSVVPQSTTQESLVLVKGSNISAYAVGGCFVSGAWDSTDDSRFAECGARVINSTLDNWYYTFTSGYQSLGLPAVPAGMGNDVWMWVRLRREVGTAIRVKMWLYSASEPGSWTLSNGDIAGLPATGGACGIYTNTVSGGARYAYVAFAVNGESAPLPGNGLTGVSLTLPGPSVSNAAVVETFGSGTVGQVPTGWTPAWVTSGVTWNVATDATRPSGKVMRVTTTSTGQHYLDSPVSDGETKQEIMARLKIVGDTGDSFGTGVAVRHADNGSGLNFTLSNNLAAWRWVGASYQAIFQGTVPYPIALNEEHWLRLKADGTIVRGRVWPATEREPSDWQWRTTETALAGGSPALISYDSNTIDVVEVQVASGAPPSAPTGLSATGAPGAVNLSWTDASSNESGFRVYRGTTTGFVAGSPLATTAAGATSYADTTGTAGTTYYYKVTAYNAAGESAATAEASAAPQISTVSATGTVYLQGAPQSGATVYAINLTTGVVTTATTNGSGVYTFNNLPSGTYHLTCEYLVSGLVYGAQAKPRVIV